MRIAVGGRRAEAAGASCDEAEDGSRRVEEGTSPAVAAEDTSSPPPPLGSTSPSWGPLRSRPESKQ